MITNKPAPPTDHESTRSVNALLVFAHPDIRASRVNSALLKAAKALNGVMVLDLYERYPDFHINKRLEQDRLAAADFVIFQHPLYFYSTPSIMKEYLDVVLEQGFAYGRGGDKLKGKAWLQALSTGGKQEAYSAGGYNRHEIGALLKPFELTAALCQMVYQPPFIVHDAHRISEHDIQQMANQYQSLILRLMAQAATSTTFLPDGALQ